MNTHTDTPTAEAQTSQSLPKNRPWLAPVLILALVAGLGALLLAGIVPRLAQVKHLEAVAAERPLKVSVATATPAEAKVNLSLPSSVEAAQETPLYPRVNGYVKTIFADIGARVKVGEVLAEIEAPELDEQVNQAQAALEQAKSNLSLAQISYTRWEALQKTRVVAAQEVDERKAALDARKADQQAAQANLQRLQQLRGFQKITAPFDGTVTKRFVEVGQLVTGDLNDTTRILFQVARTDALRAFVNVPQSSYRFISVGQTVELSFRELPGRSFPATVARTSGALDQTTRTLRTEVRVPIESGELVPGLYATVNFQVQRDQPPISVPARAIIIQSKGPQIAILDAQNNVTLRAVILGRDSGKDVEIESGLTVGERFVTNPSDKLRDGSAIEIESTPAPQVAAR